MQEVDVPSTYSSGKWGRQVAFCTHRERGRSTVLQNYWKKKFLGEVEEEEEEEEEEKKE